MTARRVTKEGIELIKKEMEDNNCPYYAQTLLDKFSFFHGRVGVYCDSCKVTDCEHNIIKLTEKGIKNGYVMNYVSER